MPPEAKLRYAQHKHSARERGIEFDLTLDEWWEIWEPHFANRGRATNQLQMCRTRDEGAYRSGNVRIATARENQAEREVTMTRRLHVAENVQAETIRERQRWVQRDEAGLWGGDFFRKMEYLEENASDFLDDEIP